MFPLLSIIAGFYGFFWHNVPYQWRVLPFGTLNLFCSFAIAKVCVLSSIWMISWSSFALSGQVKGHACFCVPCWSVLVYISIFPSQTFASLNPLPFWGCVGILSTCWYLYLPDKLADIQQLALSLLHTPHVMVHKVMSFLGKANFCINGHSQLWRLCHVIQSDMLRVYHSPTHLFSRVHFSP